jgi:outer membrane cobalamin receptor
VDEEIVVRSTKLEKSVTELTQSVTIISEDDILLKGYSDFTEVLRSTAGIEFKQAGGPGQFNYPKMRGFATSAILVVIDGVKVNDANSGGVSNLLGQIDPASIERVEILRGPQAVLYGANSTAGVISITTKGGQRKDANVSLEAGSMDWRRAALSFRNTIDGDNGDFAYSLNLSSVDSNNVHPEEFTRDATIQGKLSYDMDKVGFGLSMWQTDNEFQYAELDEAGSGVTRDTHWAFQTPDPNQYSATKDTVVGAWFRHDISARLSQRIQFGSMDKSFDSFDANNGLLGYQPAPFDNFEFPSFSGMVYDRGDLIPITDTGTDIASFYRDSNEQFDYNLVYERDRAGMVIGAEYLDQTARKWGSYGESDNDEAVASLYASGEIDLGEKVILALGVRSDDFDSWGRETTGNIGFAFELGGASTLFTNFGTSFTAPNMSQLFSIYGDPSLLPQGGETVELGWRHSGNDGGVNVEAVLWHTDLEDVVVYDGSIPNPRVSLGFGQYTNRDRQTTKGVELTASYALSASLSIDGNYTYTESNNKAEGGDWARTVQIAKNKGNMGLNYQNDKLYVSGNAYYSGPRLRWAGDVEMKAYTRVDLTGRYSFSESLSGFVRIENLFDTDIEEGLGYRQPGTYGVLGLQYRFF